jgi:TIR domain
MRGGVFVCHASQDAGMAQRAVAALEAAGVPCWIAPRDIDAGENYTQAILEALDAARAIVLVFSSATNESPHVTRELETAVGIGRPIIPVRLEQVEPSASLRYFIGTSQWLDVGGAADDWSPTLVRAVRRAIGQDTGPTPVVRAVVHETVRPPPTGWRGRRTAIVGVGLAAAIAVAVGLAIVLTGGDDPANTATDSTGGQGQSVAPRSASADPSTEDSASASESQDTPPASEAQEPSPTQVTTTVAASANAGPVTCWDASSAPDAGHCPVPAGRTGMATVFPGLSSACTPVDSPIEGKDEVYECLHDGFVVRYTRWDPTFDKESYYEVENQVASQPWQVSGEAAGLQWFSVEQDPAEEQPYQWSAAYAGLPFSLSVEGDTSADRSAGVSGLELVPPGRVGLAH